MITREVLHVLSDKKILLDKLTGIATNGAAVMTGKKSGVLQWLKEICPNILSTHGLTHRLALSCSGVSDKSPYLIKYQGLYKDIF